MQILSANSEIILQKLLVSSGIISIREIQEGCNLSRKYVAYELQKLDVLLQQHGACINAIRGKGYEIQIHDSEQYQIFRDGFLHNNRRNQYLYFSKNILAYQILFDLVLNNRYFSINDLSDKYHYSRGSISSSLKTVKAIMSKYGCELLGRPNHGLKFEGEEWNKRVCLIYTDKIAYRMNTIISNCDKPIQTVIDKDKYDIRVIECIIKDVLNQYELQMPYINLTKLKLYIMISQIRIDCYDALEFNNNQLTMILSSCYLPAGLSIAQKLIKAGFDIRQKDRQAITAILHCFCTRINEWNEIPEIVDGCKEDTIHLIEYIKGHYLGIDHYLDDAFIHEFTCYLAGMKARCLFQLPPDEESIFQVKRDGSFVSDICRDFAIFYNRTYKTKLPETEILQAYYIFHSSFSRYISREAKYRVILVSRYGIHFARDVVSRIWDEYRMQIALIDVIEYTNVEVTDLGEYDFLITDIELDRYNFLEIPTIKLDFFRNLTEANSLNKHLSLLIASELQEMIQDKYLINNKNFKNKQQVYSYLAENYVPLSLGQEFIDDCLINDSFLSDERRNRIVLVSAAARFYDKKEIVILFNKAPFLWDNEQVQMIILFNRKNKSYIKLKTLNLVLITFIHAHVGLAQKLSISSAKDIIEFIISELYP